MQKIIVFVKVLFSAKVRQALALISQNRLDDGHELLKSSVMSQRHGLNARSAMVHFYVSQQQFKVAKEFAVSTLKDHDGSHDPYSLCAAAWVFFNIARENRDPQAAAERRKYFVRATEAYERALYYDPKCAIAAQGLALIAAEDALGPGGSDEAMRKVQGAREALDIFGKVRESLNDPSVYINIGHCHFVCDDFGRAIESVSLTYDFDNRLLMKYFSTKRPRKSVRRVLASILWCYRVCAVRGIRRQQNINHLLGCKRRCPLFRRQYTLLPSKNQMCITLL